MVVCACASSAATPGDSAELRPRHPTAEPPVPTAAAIDASCPAAESISTRHTSPHGRKGTHDARPVEPDARAARGARLRLGRRTVRDGYVPRLVHGHRAGPRDRRLVGAAHAHGIPHRHRHRSARARPALRSLGSAAGPALGTRGVRALGRCDSVLPHDRRLRRAAVRPGILGGCGRRRGARHRRRPQPRCRHRPRAEPDRDRRRPRAAAGAADRRTRQHRLGLARRARGARSGVGRNAAGRRRGDPRVASTFPAPCRRPGIDLPHARRARCATGA